MKSIKLFLFGWTGLICLAFPAVAQSQFKVIDSVIAGGGITLSKGGAYALSGTIGQPFTESLRGGNFNLPVDACRGAGRSRLPAASRASPAQGH